MSDDLPEFRDWSRVAVMLMRGVVYSDTLLKACSTSCATVTLW